MKQMKREMLVVFITVTCGNPKCDTEKRIVDLSRPTLGYGSCCSEFAKNAEKALAPLRKKYEALDQ